MYVNAAEEGISMNILHRAEYVKSSDMSVFPVHVICKDDELDDVRVHRLAETL